MGTPQPRALVARWSTDASDPPNATDDALTVIESFRATSIVALGFVTRDSRVVRINPMLTAVHGGDVSEQLERSIDDVVPSPSPPLEPMYQIVMDTQSPLVSREVAGPTSANPDVTHSSLTKLSLATIHAVIIGVGIVVVDITERKRRISRPDRQEQSLRT